MNIDVKNFRSEVFKRAHKCYKYTLSQGKGITFSEALKTAWGFVLSFYETQKEKAKKAKAKAKALKAIKGQTDITNDLARVEKIARNINAFETDYDYNDTTNGRWGFWNDLNQKIRKILYRLNQRSKEAVKSLCQPQQALYFGL